MNNADAGAAVPRVHEANEHGHLRFDRVLKNKHAGGNKVLLANGVGVDNGKPFGASGVNDHAGNLKVGENNDVEVIHVVDKLGDALSSRHPC